MSSLLQLVAALALSCAAASSAVAECPIACPEIASPVCASNNKTYGNDCFFNIEKCKTNDSALTIVHAGQCTAAKPECNLEFACLDVAEPVCASNNVTYVNKCVLQKAQCVDKTIKSAYNGECKQNSTAPSSAPPANTTTTPAKTTVPPQSASGSGGNDSVACVRGCTKEINYVCGSDGVTYANECLLEEKKTCETPTLTKAKDGECSKSSSSATTTPAPSTKSSAVAATLATVGTGVACVFATIVLA